MDIALSGKMASGKTTAVQYLVDKYGFVRVGFADTIKDLESVQANLRPILWQAAVHPIAERIVTYCNDFDWVDTPLEIFRVENLILEIFKKFPQMPGEKNRGLLQQLGSTLRQEFDEDIWINCLFGSIEVNDVLSSENIVVEDLRYRNEFDALRDSGFVLVRLEVSPEVQLRRIEERYQGPVEKGVIEAFMSHSSETDLDGWKKQGYGFDYVIRTDGPVEDLYRALDSIVEERGGVDSGS